MNNPGTICLHNQAQNAYTQISNTFIDEYMPAANGTYVKVYLTLLRMVSNLCFNVSISDIADALELTEKDVTRALNYWEKKGLLVLTRNASNVICDITFNTPVTSDKPVTSVSDTAAADDTACTDMTVNDASATDTNCEPAAIKSYTTSELSQITSKDEFIWIVNIIEKYMQRNLTPTDVELVAYLYDELHFNSDLIFFLYENCISRGKKNSKYIQAVALNWAKAGVDSVEKASLYLAEYDNRYMDVMRALGLNQAPAPVQKQYIDTWLSYGFEPAVIKEACDRTMIAVGGANFKYANGILENWKRQGVKTLEEIKVADDIHASASRPASAPQPRGKKGNSFSSYEQRSYSQDDYASIEHQLLNK